MPTLEEDQRNDEAEGGGGAGRNINKARKHECPANLVETNVAISIHQNAGSSTDEVILAIFSCLFLPL
jgi:hypothetical protein